VSDGTTTVRFTDVVVGDVWGLSGQSNINVMLKDCVGGTQAISESGAYPNIRLYLVPQTGSLTNSPSFIVQLVWQRTGSGLARLSICEGFLNNS